MGRICFMVIPMNNLLSYCGLIDAKIRASDKDLPVKKNANLTVYHNRKRHFAAL